MSMLLQQMTERLAGGQPVVQSVVLGHGGSAPRTTGATMLVYADGTTAGTVGGGSLEARVQAEAKALFNLPAGTLRLLDFDLSNEDAANAGMICGGRQQVLMQLVTPDEASLAVYRWALAESMNGRDIVVLHDLGPEGHDLGPEGHDLGPEGDGPGWPVGRVLARWSISPGHTPEGLGEDLARRALDSRRNGGLERFSHQGRLYLSLACIQPGTVVLFGAGHVAQHTAAAAKRAGFLVTVLDDRAEFANRERFPEADRILVPDSLDSPNSLAQCLKDLAIDANSYLVIVTRGHEHDMTVLAQVLDSPAAYLGMIGSRTKRDAIYSVLRRQGASEEALSRVCCPIGLPIGAETPEEIAVSITAELIQARARRRGSRKNV